MFYKLPSVSMWFHKVRVSEVSSGSLEFSEVLQHSQCFSKVFNGPLWFA